MSALMASASAMPARAAEAPSASAVQEVIITATKRSQSLQTVPISVQALTPKILTEQHVVSFDDYAKLLPSVSFQSFGPGQAQPYFRGITSGSDGLHSGSEPGTGIYIDEMPVTTIANGVDLHMYDISRVEALSGPQGTLFGASSLSGTLRIITNQPDPTKFSGSYDLQGDTFTGHGAGGVAEGYVNIPLIEDKVAIRLVGFSEHDGGYIDNVLKTRVFQTTGGIYNPGPINLVETNTKYAKKDFNYVDTYGGRAALGIDLNDNWTVTPSVIYQNQGAHGNFLYNPKVGDLETSDFAPEHNTDIWYQAGLTIKGKIANWDVLYAGGYFDRTVDNDTDYSYYAVAYNAAQESSYVTFPDGHGGYLDPDQIVHSNDVYTKQSHEFRISSPSDYFIHGTIGAFTERQTDTIKADYVVPGLAAAGDPRSVKDTTNYADAGDDIYYTRIYRVDRDTAYFGEGSVDFTPKLTLTAGYRYFTVDNSLNGVSGFTPPPASNKDAKEYGETHKVSLSYKFDAQHMAYFTWSTGFRPGGPNRRSVLGDPPINIASYQPDTVTNYELGWKTTWLDNKLRINGALFDEEWHDVQFSLSPEGAQGITAIFNVGYAQSRGIEGDIAYRPDEHWTFTATGAFTDAHLTKTFCTQTEADGSCAAGQFAFAGTQLPIQPKVKVNATARYEFSMDGFNNFFQASAQTQSATTSALVSSNEQELGPTAGFTTVDLSAGASRGNSHFEVFVQNVLDDRGTLSINIDCSIAYCGPYPLKYPTKPRFVGVKFGQAF